MKDTLFQNKLIVKKSPLHGYGVFAGKKIKKGEIVEECCFLEISRDLNPPEDYAFNHGEKSAALLLGYGMLYNHSDVKNVAYIFDQQKQIYLFTAVRDIHKGEELCIFYGKDWFASRNAIPLKTNRRIYRAMILKAGLLISAIYSSIWLLHHFA